MPFTFNIFLFIYIIIFKTGLVNAFGVPHSPEQISALHQYKSGIMPVKSMEIFGHYIDNFEQNWLKLI